MNRNKKKQYQPRRFEASKTTILAELRRTMAKLKVTSYKVRLEEKINPDDRPLAEIYFELPDRRSCFSRCAAWSHELDNLRAAQLAIEYSYRIAESYGVEMMSQTMATDFVYSIFKALEPVTATTPMLMPGNDRGDVVDAEVL